MGLSIQKILFSVAVLSFVGCSTLTQTFESPVVTEKKKYAIGVGSVYGHNIYKNSLDDKHMEESTAVGFAGGRYGLFQNMEVSLTGGSLGLNLGTSLDLRARYTWLGGWKDPADRRRAIEDDANADFNEKDLEDRPRYVPNGWLSTAGFGVFWSGYNDVQEDSVGLFDSGVYFSNAVGWKKGRRLYYFGGKVIQLETTYQYKVDRLSVNYDIDSKYSQLTFGVFFGYTYSWKTRRRHLYQIDTLFSVTQLPTSPEDRTNRFYPALTISGWFQD